MFVNTTVPRSITPNVFEAMRNSDFKFYLTGSRFFGHERRDSDWDFFVESGGYLLLNWLEANGFVLESNSDYISDGIIQIWKHRYLPVHVQVINDAIMKDMLQVYIKASPELNKLMSRTPREHRKFFWQAAVAWYKEARLVRKPCIR